MSEGRRRWAWSMLIGAIFWLQPLSCLFALNLEPLGPDDHYGGVDPHGFGALGAVIGAGLLFLPVRWLLTGWGHADSGRRPPGRNAAILAVVATPSLMQISYLRGGTIDWVWPVVAAAVLWFVLVALLALHHRADWPSPHARFATHPRAAWGIVGGIALAAAVMLTAPMWA